MSESPINTLPKQYKEDSKNSIYGPTITTNSTINIPLPGDQEDSQIASKCFQIEKEQNINLQSTNTPSHARTDSKDNEIIYNVQNKTSTPKTYIDIKDIKMCENPSLAGRKTKKN